MPLTLWRTRNPAKQLASTGVPWYMPPSMPSTAALSSTPPSCTTTLPPISMASSAVTVVWPSAPLPPFSVRPAEVSERWLPGSATAHCEESNAGPLKLSSSSVRMAVAIGGLAEIEDGRGAVADEGSPLM